MPPEPKPQIFLDSATADRLMVMIMELASELHVVKDRMRVLEKLLERNGQLHREELDYWQPDDQDAKESARERDAFIARLLQDAVSNPE
jgi:hypothetical protein